MNCPRCGRKVRPKQSACPNRTAPLDVGAETQPPPPARPQPPPPRPAWRNLGLAAAAVSATLGLSVFLPWVQSSCDPSHVTNGLTGAPMLLGVPILVAAAVGLLGGLDAALTKRIRLGPAAVIFPAAIVSIYISWEQLALYFIHSYRPWDKLVLYITYGIYPQVREGLLLTIFSALVLAILGLVAFTARFSTHLPPGTMLAGVCGVVLLVVLLADVGPIGLYEFSGYAHLWRLVQWLLWGLLDTLWAILILPVSAIVALVGLARNYGKSTRSIRRYTAFVILISGLALVYLVWLLIVDARYDVARWANRLAFLFGGLILLGNVGDLLGVRWSSIAEMPRKLARWLQVIWARLQALLLRLRSAHLVVKLGLFALPFCLTAAAVLFVNVYNSSPFNNRVFKCPYLEDTGSGYLFHVKRDPSLQSYDFTSVEPEELQDFCARMRQRFADSNLTIGEAKQFYALLNDSQVAGLDLYNESEHPMFEPPKRFVLKRQVMVKKVTDDRYEILYYRHSYFAILYEYAEVYLDGGAIIEYVPIERWGQLTSLDWLM